MGSQINTNGATVGVAPAFTEAPASCTVKVVSALGYEYLLTMRSVKVSDVLSQARTLETWLVENNWTPAPSYKPSQTAKSVQSDETAPVCQIHKTPMTKRSKDGRSWWSCSSKLDDGTFCPYRPKSN